MVKSRVAATWLLSRDDGSQGTRLLPRSLRVASHLTRLGPFLKKGIRWTNPGQHHTAPVVL